MPFLRRLRLAAAAGLALAALPASAQQPLSPDQKAEIRGVVREYLMEHPEIIVEALQALQAREEQAQAEARRKLLSDLHGEIFEDPTAPIAGNPQGDVTLVEFFDYQCGYCKSVNPALRELIRSDGKLRVVFKEFPILGPASVVAARAALAAERQGKYLPFHNALMEQRGQLDEAKILRIAGSVGLDVDRLKADMQDPGIQASLQRNLRVAERLQIQGTPAFILGETIIPGAVPLEQLEALIEAERRG